MLASITPLGERGRHSHYAVTVAAFALGALVAATVLGALLGAVGALLLGGLGDRARSILAAIALFGALALDTCRVRAPRPARQVDERWLDRYRGWVYGLGYGAQLGLGVCTVVTSAATYAMLVCALLAGGALGGALVLGVYGALRGLTPLLAAGVRTPRQLAALHARLARAEAATRAAGMAALAAAAVAGVLASLQ